MFYKWLHIQNVQILVILEDINTDHHTEYLEAYKKEIMWVLSLNIYQINKFFYVKKTRKLCCLLRRIDKQVEYALEFVFVKLIQMYLYIFDIYVYILLQVKCIFENLRNLFPESLIMVFWKKVHIKEVIWFKYCSNRLF